MFLDAAGQPRTEHWLHCRDTESAPFIRKFLMTAPDYEWSASLAPRSCPDDDARSSSESFCPPDTRGCGRVEVRGGIGDGAGDARRESAESFRGDRRGGLRRCG